MFHVPAHKVPADQPQPGQIYFDPRLALVYVDPAPKYERRVCYVEDEQSNSEYRNDRRAYP